MKWIDSDEISDELSDAVDALERRFESQMHTRSDGNMIVWKFVMDWMERAYEQGATQALSSAKGANQQAEPLPEKEPTQ